MPVRQAVILCGGVGARLGERVRDVPKPLLPVGGRPVLDHVIDCLAAAGVSDFILAAGYLGSKINEYYGSGDRHPRCKIRTVIEDEPLGTAGAVRACGELLDEDFVLAYGDVFIDFSAEQLIATHEAHHPLATLLVRASDHPWDSHLVDTDASGRVREFIHRHDPERRYRNIANAAVYVLSRRVLEFIPADRPSDFGADVFPAAIAAGAILCTHKLEEEGFVKDMGTPDRLQAVEEYLTERALGTAARSNPEPIDTVFLDRDGVLNADLDLIHRPEQLELLPGAAEAVARLTRHGIRSVVVTNQPVIARGLCTEETLTAIHEKLRQLIRSGGGELSAIYHCPHHPETHHGEGVPSLRRACRCRKPAPGMLFRARRELGLNLARCAMVGDHAIDVRAGRAAGVRTVLVGPSSSRAAEAAAACPDEQFDSLLAFAEAVTERRAFRQ
jgi:mannose-1-phosphate guanylyltransferase/phosphomannomutase